MQAFFKGGTLMNFKQIAIGFLTVTYLVGAAMLLPNVGQAQDAKVKTAMELLESTANKLGPPRIQGRGHEGDKTSASLRQ